MSDSLAIGVILFAATFTQGVAGFGLALVAMPLLVALVGIEVAAPLVAAIGLFVPAIIAWHLRRDLALPEITAPAAGSLIGIPVGVIALGYASKEAVTLLLGLVIVGYVVYVGRAPASALPQRRQRDGGWGGYGWGVLAGLLTGAYNTGGPPLVIYGTSRGWPPATFKANLQALLVIHSVAVVISHALSGHYSVDVWRAVPAGLGAGLAGTAAGLALSRFIDAVLFRRIVLAVLLALGVSLIVTSL